jgi:hypothetical protein
MKFEIKQDGRGVSHIVTDGYCECTAQPAKGWKLIKKGLHPTLVTCRKCKKAVVKAIVIRTMAMLLMKDADEGIAYRKTR